MPFLEALGDYFAALHEGCWLRVIRRVWNLRGNSNFLNFHLLRRLIE